MASYIFKKSKIEKLTCLTLLVMWPSHFFSNGTLLNVLWQGLCYASLTYKKHHHDEQNVPSFSFTPNCSGPQDTSHGFTLDTLNFLFSRLWVSFSGCWHLCLHPCLHSFLYPITCLKYLIFLLHLLRAWWLLRAHISNGGAFLGEIHLLSALAGNNTHLLHGTKGVFIRTLRFPIHLPSALFFSNSLFNKVTFSSPILVSYFEHSHVKPPFSISVSPSPFSFLGPSLFPSLKVTHFREFTWTKSKLTIPFVLLDNHIIR